MDVHPALVAPDKSWLASASYDDGVRIWDPTSATVHDTVSPYRPFRNGSSVTDCG